MSNVDILGYLATLFVLLSMLMVNIKKLRYINSLGCFLFVVYGIAIQAYPIVIMNAFCLLIHIYHIRKLRQKN